MFSLCNFFYILQLLEGMTQVQSHFLLDSIRFSIETVINLFFCQKNISLTMNPSWHMEKQMTGTNTIRFCHFYILDLSLSYFQPIKIVKRFSFSCDNRARRWLAGSWSDFPLSYFRFVHFIFQTKKFLSSNFQFQHKQ